MRDLFIIFSLLTLSLSAVANQPDSLVVESQLEEVAAEQISDPNLLWDSANTAYINGSYSEAIELYSSIEEQGLMSDKLYFNLGNAHYKNNDMAHAILYYQKALVITPNDADFIYNLEVAQAQIKDQIEEIPEFFLRKWSRAISRSLDCTGWSIISLVALGVLLASILIFLLSNSIALRKSGFGVGLFAALILFISTIYALDERQEMLNNDMGVIMSQSIAIKSSPDRSATDLFMLHSGTTVKILRELDDWYEIVIADGKTGWIESKRVAEI